MKTFLIVLASIICLTFAYELAARMIQGAAVRGHESKEQFQLTKSQTVTVAKLTSMVYPQDERHEQWRERIGSRLSDIGCELVEIKTSSGVESMAVKYGQVLAIVFRGTSGRFDWVTNLLAWRKKAPFLGSAHSGFQMAAELAYKQLNYRQLIIDAQNDGLTVIACGHSQGAAEAIQFFGVAEEDMNSIHGVVAICAPRSANWTHSREMDKRMAGKLLRITNCRDLVSLVPPVVLGYRHIGQCVYFDMHGRFHPVLTLTFRAADLFGATVRDAFQLLRLRLPVGYHSANKVAILVEKHIDQFDMLTGGEP